VTSVDSDTRPRPATGGPPVIQLDLDNRISSTGTETKAHNVQTGTVFNMDFQKMQQVHPPSRVFLVDGSAILWSLSVILGRRH
jgi:hypothetical protein